MKRQTTGGDGAFQFVDVPDGPYVLFAGDPTHPPAFFGRQGVIRQRIEVMLETGTALHDVHISLSRGAVATGVVRLPSGEPAPMVEVALLPHSSGVPVENPPTGVTDAFGRYRIFGVPPGNYVIGARLVASAEPTTGERGEMIAPTLFGNVLDLETATPVTLGPGATVAADITLRTVMMASVHGTLESATPITRGTFRVRASPLLDGPTWWRDAWSRATVNSESGDFRLRGLAAREYLIEAQVVGSRWSPDGNAQLALSRVWLAAGENPPVAMLPGRGLTVEGRVVCADTVGVLAQPQTIQLQAVGTSSSLRQPTPVAPDGRFRVGGLVPGRYAIRLFGVGGQWPVHSADIVVGDADVTAAVVRCSARPTTVSGVVSQRDGAPVSGVAVVAVRADVDHSSDGVTVRVMIPSSSGRYELIDIWEGAVTVAVVPLADIFEDPMGTVDLVRTTGTSIQLTLGEQRVMSFAR